MQFGAVFPTCEIGTDPIAIRDFAQAAEALGFAQILVYDHVLGADHANRLPPISGPYTENDPFHEPMTLLAYLAGVTKTIRLATGVLVLPQRQVALVAKQAAELAVLSNNRFFLGAGIGWNQVEYQALGVDFGTRGRMLEEQVQVLRRLWTEPVVSFQGEFHTIERAGILPRPEVPIPVSLGGGSKAAVRRAVRIGDGFMFGGTNSQMKELCGYLLDALEQSGRREKFHIDTIMGIGFSSENRNRKIAEWQALGTHTISVRTMSTGTAFVGEPDPGYTRPQQHIDALESFIREVEAVPDTPG